MISRVWSPELLKMSGLKGFLIFLGAIALLGTVVAWWVGPQMLMLVFDGERRSQPLTVLHLADYAPDNQSLYLARYETPLLDYLGAEGVPLLWQANLEHAVQGRVMDEWKRIHQLRFNEAAGFLQTVTSSEFRGLSSVNVAYRRLVLAVNGDLPDMTDPVVVLLLLQGADAAPDDLASLKANLDDYQGEAVWDTPIEVFEIGEPENWNRLVAIGFTNALDANGWLRDPGSVTERALAAARHERMVTLLLSTEG